MDVIVKVSLAQIATEDVKQFKQNYITNGA